MNFLTKLSRVKIQHKLYFLAGTLALFIVILSSMHLLAIREKSNQFDILLKINDVIGSASALQASIQKEMFLTKHQKDESEEERLAKNAEFMAQAEASRKLQQTVEEHLVTLKASARLDLTRVAIDQISERMIELDAIREQLLNEKGANAWILYAPFYSAVDHLPAAASSELNDQESCTWVRSVRHFAALRRRYVTYVRGMQFCLFSQPGGKPGQQRLKEYYVETSSSKAAYEDQYDYFISTSAPVIAQKIESTLGKHTIDVATPTFELIEGLLKNNWVSSPNTYESICATLDEYVASSNLTLADLKPDQLFLLDLQPFIVDEMRAYAIGKIERIHREEVVTGSLLFCLLLIAPAISVIMTRSISRPIRQVSAVLDKSALQSQHAADKMQRTSNSLADTASEQAAAIEEISSSIEEMSSMISSNHNATVSAEGISENVKIATLEASTQMDGLDKSMAQIIESSDEIAKIIKVIEEIAFQTNLLALNAAVEAARAGEAGAGFAVVAEEVRNLAQRSARAAVESNDKITAARKNSEKGGAISKTVDASLVHILKMIDELDDHIKMIRSGSEELDVGGKQMSSAMSEMSNAVQGSAANASDSAATAEQQKQVVADLVDQVRVLRDMVIN